MRVSSGREGSSRWVGMCRGKSEVDARGYVLSLRRDDGWMLQWHLTGVNGSLRKMRCFLLRRWCFNGLHLFLPKGRFLQLFPWAGLSLTSCVGGPVRVGYFPIIKGEEVVLNIFTQGPRLMHLFLSIYSCPPLPICIFIHFTLHGSFRGWVW